MMVDISNALKDTMQKEKCTSLYALLLISKSEKKEEKDVYILQSKSGRKSSR